MDVKYKISSIFVQSIHFMRSVFTLLFFFLLVLPAVGQQLPLQNHYFLNPYVYNPALAGYENHAIAYVNRRQQIGNNEAPTHTSFIFNTPVASSGGFGLSFFTNTYDTASRSLAYASFSRVIPLTEDQYFRFGISAGFGLDKIDLKSINNPGIPGVQSGVESKAHFQAQIGIHYQWQALQLGLSLPGLFKPEPIDLENPDDFSPLDFDPFRGVLFSAGYLVAVNEQVEIQPQLLYRISKDSANQWELGAIAQVQKQFWVGASYRHDYGAIAMLGVHLQDVATIGYAIEFSGSQEFSPEKINHEIQIGIRMGPTRLPVKKGFKVKKQKQEGSKEPRFYYEPKRTGRSQ